MTTLPLRARRPSSHLRLHACRLDTRWILFLALLLVPLLSAPVATAAKRQPDPPQKRAAKSAKRPKPKGVTHQVQKGQTLFRIALAYGLKVAALAEANGIKPSVPLRVGQRLFIPGATAVRKSIEAYTPLTAEERSSLERSLRERTVEPAAPPPIPPPAPPPAPGPPTPRTRVRTDAEYVWPIQGPVNSPFGPRNGRLHAGIDIGSPHYQEVAAAADAEVIYAKDTRGPLGMAVILQHGRGVRTVYAHLSVIIAREGDTVRQGQAIGGVGDTGRATGPHLHFEIRRNGEALNPETHLPATIDDLVKDLSHPRR